MTLPLWMSLSGWTALLGALTLVACALGRPRRAQAARGPGPSLWRIRLGVILPAPADGSATVLLRTGEDIPELMLVGISLGAVFMGAMTYIGNGPNFMVKSIAEQSGVRMPTFFGYVFKYSLPVLIPVFVLVTVMFLI